MHPFLLLVILLLCIGGSSSSSSSLGGSRSPKTNTINSSSSGNSSSRRSSTGAITRWGLSSALRVLEDLWRNVTTALFRASAEGECNQEVTLIKIGGSALTDKRVLEKLREGNLESVCQQLASVIAGSVSTSSQRPPLLIIVHGAGSFGHFQARDGSLSTGGGTDWRESSVITHASVAKLNALLLAGLRRNGIKNAVHLPLFPSLVTRGRNDIENIGPLCTKQLGRLLSAGFLPVLHGDVVLDTRQSCTIFSGDRILQFLATSFNRARASKFRVNRVVFLTDVEGVFDKAPERPGAALIRTIRVNKEGISSLEMMASGGGQVPAQLKSIDTSSSTTIVDVTGGIRGKIDSACRIAIEARVPVFITQIGTIASLDCIAGRVTTERCTTIIAD